MPCASHFARSKLLRLGLEHLDELAPDDLALGFGVDHAGQMAEELRARIDRDHPGMQPAGEHLHHHRALVQPQQAVVDEHAGQLVADRAVDQRRGHARIDTARQAEDHLLVADLLADARHRLVDVVAHHPVGLRLRDPEHEAVQQLAALGGVCDLGVELHAVVAACFVGHAGDGTARRARHQLEAGRQRGNLVAVAHPDLQHAVALDGAEVLDAFEQLRVAMRAHLGVAELAVVGGLDPAALLHRHREHAVADAQNRHPQVPHRLRRAQLVLLVGRGVAARQDDAFRRERADERVAHIVRVDLAEHVRLAHATRDQLRDLGAEVEDQDLVVHGGGQAQVVDAAAASISRLRRSPLKWRTAITIEAACSRAQK